MDGAEESKKNENGDSADLVYEFMKQEDDEEMELSLGLSMNGRFGVDPTKETLRRSSSLSDVFVTDNSVGNGRNAQARAAEFGSYAPLVRASSLPPELETQERRHQEVFQNPMVVNENGNCSGESDGDGSHVDTNETPRLQEATRGSSSRESPHEPVLERRPAGVTSYRGDTSEGNIRNPVIDMPYVSTRGLGPENSQINGFLYRYKKGEDVKIVCVCHGLFLSPAEFVKHGGGGDVSNPLKHIVVTPFPF